MFRTFLSSLFFSALLLLSGCANVGSEHHYEQNSQTQKESKITTMPSNGMALVFLINPDLPLRNTSAVSIPPKAFAINSSLVAIMPYPSYTRLALQPGSYKFNFISYHKDFLQVHSEKTFSFDPNKVYFVKGYYTIFSNELSLVSEREGDAAVRDFPLAKTLHQNIPIDLAKKRVIWSKSEFPEKFPSNSSSVALSSSSTQSTITAADVSDFFATVGAIALVVLMLYGLGAASAAALPALPPPSPSIINPPAQTLNLNAMPTSVRSASGRVIAIEQRQNTGTIYNRTTGAQYRIDGDNVVGTDGSRYRVNGNTIFSNNGNYYTRAGNSITSNDGRSCQVIGNLIDCN